ncbi:MAG: TolC family protein [Planctomycetes bacterium]|nr:TolC family protein [Planctomycetota bacterium]
MKENGIDYTSVALGGSCECVAPGFGHRGCVIALVLLLVPASFLGIAGCQPYQALPLTAPTVNRALTVPEMPILQVQAETLRHPVLGPVQLNLQNGLSPDEAAVLAVLLHPSLRAERDKRALADAQLLQARLLPNPELAFSFETPVAGETTGTVNGFGVELNWDIQPLWSRSARVQAAQANRASVALDIAWQEWQVAQAAKRAVYRLVNLDDQVALAREIECRRSADVGLLRRAVQNGTKTSDELVAAEVAQSQAIESLIELQQQAAVQNLALRRALGMPPDYPIRIEEGTLLPARFQAPAATELTASLEQERLDLVALRRGYDSQEAAVRAAILNQFPKVSIGPTYARDVENVDTIGFGLGITLPVFDRNQGRIAAEQATRQKLFDEYVNRVFEARADVSVLLAKIESLNREIAAAEDTQSQSRRLESVYHQAMLQGRVDVLTYLTAWYSLANSRQKLLTLKGQLAQTIIDLESATGLYRIPEVGAGPAAGAVPQKESVP